MAMPLWRFIPAAPQDDKAWLASPIWPELLVRAPSSGEARQLASSWERRYLENNYRNAAVGSAALFQSALSDPGLYHIQEIGPDDDDEPDGVIFPLAPPMPSTSRRVEE